MSRVKFVRYIFSIPSVNIPIPFSNFSKGLIPNMPISICFGILYVVILNIRSLFDLLTFFYDVHIGTILFYSFLPVDDSFFGCQLIFLYLWFKLYAIRVYYLGISTHNDVRLFSILNYLFNRLFFFYTYNYIFIQVLYL